MPERGIIKCIKCDKEFEGELPNNKRLGEKYIYSQGEVDEISDSNLIKDLLKHHFDTAIIHTHLGGVLGHRDYDVFLKGGRIGKIFVTSYLISYEERRCSEDN